MPGVQVSSDQWSAQLHSFDGPMVSIGGQCPVVSNYYLTKYSISRGTFVASYDIELRASKVEKRKDTGRAKVEQR